MKIISIKRSICLCGKFVEDESTGGFFQYYCTNNFCTWACLINKSRPKMYLKLKIGGLSCENN